MSWLTLKFHPGFAADLTSWTTTIERKGKLVQRVDKWPERSTEQLRANLTTDQVRELQTLVAAVDFAELQDPDQWKVVVDDVALVSISVKADGHISTFSAPLTFWAWARSRGQTECLPGFDFDPALRLSEAIDGLSPYRARTP